MERELEKLVKAGGKKNAAVSLSVSFASFVQTGNIRYREQNIAFVIVILGDPLHYSRSQVQKKKKGFI